jgi:hypothetical protein
VNVRIGGTAVWIADIGIRLAPVWIAAVLSHICRLDAQMAGADIHGPLDEPAHQGTADRLRPEKENSFFQDIGVMGKFRSGLTEPDLNPLCKRSQFPVVGVGWRFSKLSLSVQFWSMYGPATVFHRRSSRWARETERMVPGSLGFARGSHRMQRVLTVRRKG